MKTFSVVLAICMATAVTWVSVDSKIVLCEDETRLQVANDSYDLPGKLYGAVDNEVTQSQGPESNFTIADEDVTQDDHLVSNSTAGKYVPVLRCSDSKDEQEESTGSAWTFRTLPTASSSPPFSMVTRLGVRVQGDKPEWNTKHQRFVSAYYETFDEKYRAVLDTVNMASVEGALKYVQAECINASVVDSCKRKNDIKYVVFYQTNVVQPSAAMKYYAKAIDEHKFAIESCPFVPLDGGRCNPNADGSFPKECDQYIGAAGEPKLGFCVGGTLQDNEAIAPYPHNYWFSFPNSCPLELWDHKTDSCRKEFAGGLCPHGVEPDGVTCTFSYKILGYILLDDVVGITSMVNSKTGDKYADYHEFCEAGGIEFSATISTSLAGGHSRSVVDMTEGLEFWANPGNRDANGARVEKLVSAYNELVSKKAKTNDGGVMRPLPTVSELRARNPPCFENSLVCAKSKFGCKRSYRSQICQRCTSDDSDCERSGDRAP
uniref:RxLR effector candidate protein n=1 Tax=Hyaloperonospora arabidopsidis (strain Emoy2) TaxID=559515 RepID=M4C0E3_HYAAE